MQVASTLWLDIKSQKLSEHQFRFKRTKWSLKTKPYQLRIGHTLELGQEEVKDSLLDEAGGGWHP